jgi:cysteinyl-tRNA synthetase
LAKNAKILWIDTEQSDFDIKWLIWKAKEKYNIESIDFFAFRELDFNEANTTPFELIEYIISIQNGYDIIVIDNITDLDDACVMDNVASTKIVRKLMKLSSDKNLALIGIVHENEKKLENVGGRGHVGSESVRKAHNVTTLTKDGENTNVTFRKTRKKAPADFEFQVDNENMPIYDVNLYVNKTDKLTSIIKADNFIDRLIANGFSKEKSYAIAQKYAIEKLQNIFNGYGLIKIKDLVIPKICELGIFETFDKGNRKMFFITKNEIPF